MSVCPALTPSTTTTATESSRVVQYAVNHSLHSSNSTPRPPSYRADARRSICRGAAGQSGRSICDARARRLRRCAGHGPCARERGEMLRRRIALVARESVVRDSCGRARSAARRAPSSRGSTPPRSRRPRRSPSTIAPRRVMRAADNAARRSRPRRARSASASTARRIASSVACRMFSASISATSLAATAQAMARRRISTASSSRAAGREFLGVAQARERAAPDRG